MKRLSLTLIALFVLFVSLSGQMIINIGPGYHTTRISSGGSSALMSNIVSYWKFDESSGTVIDSVGNNAGTASATVSRNQTTAKDGTSYLFDGTNTKTCYVNCGTNNSLKLTSGTISLWAYRTFTDGNMHVLISKMDIDGGKYGYSINSNGTIYYELADGTNIMWDNADVTMPQGQWTHIVLTWTGGTSATIYVNGTAKTKATTITPSYTTNYAFEIGMSSQYVNYSFGGYIDQVRVWSRVLSNTEVTSLYHNGL